LNVTADESGWNPNREKEQPSSSLSRGEPEQSAPRWNILLAEDNLPDALLVREAIRRENLRVEVYLASDGQQAIDFIARAEQDPNAPHPQLLLLDLNLPKVDGFEVLRRLRESAALKDIPVLITSSSDSPSDRNLAAELGAQYFRKPPSYDEFLKLGGVLKQLLRDSGME
jgi:DNA-binding response OmpR family regulator